jgi:hypothetical protein
MRQIDADERQSARSAPSAFYFWNAIEQGAPPMPLKELPEEVVEAWKEAGAEVGWVGGRKGSGVSLFREKPFGAGDLPAFRISAWKRGVLEALPVPTVPFALDLSSSKVTDAGLTELAGLKSLKRLNLGDTKVTDAGLKELAGLKGLRELDLYDTAVTGTGLKDLAGLKSLRELFLGFTKVTDTGLKGLAAGFKNLQMLALNYTKVTDAGLKELAGLKSLQGLNLARTAVTDAGVEELEKALPGCRIVK